jgi:hypothetical protein
VLDVSASQFDVLAKQKQYKLILGGRRSSKTECLVIWVIKLAVTRPGLPIAIMTEKHAKSEKIFYRKLLPKLPRGWLRPAKLGIRKSPPEQMGCTFVTGVMINFISAVNVDSPRGGGIGALAGDERQLLPNEAWDNAFLSLSEGGDNFETFETATALKGWFYEYYENAKADPEYHVDFFDPFKNPFISHKIFERAKSRMDPRLYAREVLGEFTEVAGRTYPFFDRAIHAKSIGQLQNGYYSGARKVLAERYGIYEGCGRDITSKILMHRFRRPAQWLLGMDFDISPMCAIAYKVIQSPPGIPDILWGVKELVIEEKADATRMGIYIKQAGYENSVIIPDATGDFQTAGRGPSKGKTHVRMLRELGLFVHVPWGKNPYVRDRVNSVNAKLLNARNDVTLFFDPAGCLQTIRALENQVNEKDGKPAKDNVHEHRSDAMGYPIAHLWPCSLDRAKSGPQVIYA